MQIVVLSVGRRTADTPWDEARSLSEGDSFAIGHVNGSSP